MDKELNKNQIININSLPIEEILEAPNVIRHSGFIPDNSIFNNPSKQQEIKDRRKEYL